MDTEAQWKSTVESSIAGLGDSIKQISNSLQALVNSGSGTGKKRKTKSTLSKQPKKKRVTVKKNKVVQRQNEEVPIPTDIETDTNIQSPVKDLLKAHGFSLDSIFKDVEEYEYTPVDRIPRAPCSVSGDSALPRYPYYRSLKMVNMTWKMSWVGVRGGKCIYLASET